MSGLPVLDIKETVPMKRMIAFGMAVTLTVYLTACGKQGKEREGAQASGTEAPW